MPLRSVSDLRLSSARISSSLAPVLRVMVRSTTETLGVGTLKAMPVSLPLREGMTLPTALAAPVEDGMMLLSAQRPPLQSFEETASTVFWVAVVACTVVMSPFSMPNFSCTTSASGARQLVVHDALEKTLMSLVRFLWLTPYTNIGVSSLDGALRITFLAPPSMWPIAVSFVRKTPVLSHTTSVARLPHLMDAGVFSLKTLTVWPFTVIESFVKDTFSTLPWTESYLN